MGKNIYKAVILSLLLIFLTACEQKPKILDLAGKTINFQDYRGKWVVINYWASWCPHCLKELPALNKFYAANQTRAVVFGVNYDQLNAEKLQPLVKQLQIQYPVLTSDPAAILGIKPINTIPATIIIDPKGHVSEPIIGEKAMQILQKTIKLDSLKIK